jgi:type IV pilus assembly protein PilE
MSKLPKGFTLIELIVVVAIIGILAGVGYPLYIEQSLKNRRSSAIDALTKIDSELALCKSKFGGYDCCDDGDANDVLQKVLAAPPNTDNNAYQIALAMTNVDGGQFACKQAQGYTLTATVIAGQIQDGDTCTSFTLDHTGQRQGWNGGTAKPSCWGDL